MWNGGLSADFATSMVSMRGIRVSCLRFGLESFELVRRTFTQSVAILSVLYLSCALQTTLHYMYPKPRFSLSNG